MANDLGLSCPRGGEWYICQDTKVEFVGCCTINPCSDGSGHCPPNRLRPASFSASQYGKIPAMSCDDQEPRPDSVLPLWYTCAYVNPPFLGCCYNNACVAGSCPDSNLTAARLPDEATSRDKFLQEAGVVKQSKGLSGGAIAGIVIGVIAGLALAIAGFWFLRRRRQKNLDMGSTLSPDRMNPPEYKASPNPSYSPNPSAVSPHSGYYHRTPPQGHGWENGYQTVPTELGSPSHYVAELSGNHAGEVAMLDSRPLDHHQAHSPTIPPSTTTTEPNKWPTDKK